MTIEIELSSPDELDWLAGDPTETDIWARMDADERDARATAARARALADYLSDSDTWPTDVSEAQATVLLAQFDDTELREIRRAALRQESNADYLDREASELAARLYERVPDEWLQQDP